MWLILLLPHFQLALYSVFTLWNSHKIIDNKTGKNVLRIENEWTKNVSNEEKKCCFYDFGMVYSVRCLFYEFRSLFDVFIQTHKHIHTHMHLHLVVRRIFIYVSVCLLWESVACVRVALESATSRQTPFIFSDFDSWT